MIQNIKIIKLALSQYGVTEIVGEKDNPTIVNYFKEIGYNWVKDDETAWCSCFINWVALTLGLERSRKLDARSWLDIGTEVTTPMMGDIVIFWRVSMSSWKGHVAIYINESEDGKYINVLGGNQNNKVCIRPYNKNRLLGYRRLDLQTYTSVK